MEFIAFLLFRRKESLWEVYVSLVTAKLSVLYYAGHSRVKELKSKLSVFLSILAVFSNGDKSVDRQVVQGLSAAAWPLDLDEFDFFRLS
jgi:hypothetical protein